MVKVLTVGAANGSILELFSKIQGINSKHGPFDFCLCTGNFFGNPNNSEDNQTAALLSGELEAPIECFVMQSSFPLPDTVIAKYTTTNGLLCKNVFLLSKSATFTTATGLRIACLSGTYDPSIYSSSEAAPGFPSPFFSSQTVDRLLSNTLSTSSSNSKSNYASLASIQSSSSTSQSVDILLTCAWPSLIASHSNCPLTGDELNPISGDPLDELSRKLRPKYHFVSSLGKFWEREPYVWDDDDGRVSRFINLGAFGGESSQGQAKKQRWFYAFSINPADTSSPSRPSNATNNPFTQLYRPPKRVLEESENFIFGAIKPNPHNKKAKIAADGKTPPGYKCKRCDGSDHFINDCPERVQPPEGYVCKICNVAGHLVRDCPTRHAVGDTGGKKPRPGYVCRACASESHYIEDCPVANAGPPSGHGGHKGRRGPVKEIGPDECWFCLSNPNLAKHLIVAIGNECYVTLPKGQIIPTQSQAPSKPAVPGGGHVLIVPITHYPTYSTIPSDIAPPILEETHSYKKAIRAMYAKHHCVAVFFEIGRLAAKGGHAHIQAVPVPVHLKDKIKDAYVDDGKLQGIDFIEDEAEVNQAVENVKGGRGGYFLLDLPDGQRMVHLMKDHVPFSIMFGRQVLVGLMGMPDRLDWKECALPDEEDRTDAEEFKKVFGPFNPVV